MSLISRCFWPWCECCRLSSRESLINGHIYAPTCRQSTPVPAMCSCARDSGCGRLQSLGPSLPATTFDTPYTHICTNTTLRYMIITAVTTLFSPSPRRLKRERQRERILFAKQVNQKCNRQSTLVPMLQYIIYTCIAICNR